MDIIENEIESKIDQTTTRVTEQEQETARKSWQAEQKDPLNPLNYEFTDSQW